MGSQINCKSAIMRIGKKHGFVLRLSL